MTGLHEVELTHPMWAPTVAYVAERGYTTGAPKPKGIKGGLGCHYFVLADGRIRWKLVYRERDSRKQTQVAKWVSDWLPDARKDRAAPPCKTHGKIVTVQGAYGGELARQVRVVVDSLGLPVPVPVEAAT